MKITKTKLKGVLIFEPAVLHDRRGWFIESYSQTTLKALGVEVVFVQDNHSLSIERGTLRGLHYQLHPKAQVKLVRCTNGAIFDVAVDIRKGSPSYGKWMGIELNAENKKQLYIPKGFAHGFLTLTDNVEVQYKVDTEYVSNFDRGIRWDDPTINIKWPIHNEPIVSAKDQKAPLLKDAEHNFVFGK
ncbi:dTDP-4-dehydrorhamnose 3,5-epimerase [Peribacillus sp. NPDC096379]|uniref:dTDP-4-dehydrorhamnose 3,5-epimerase n=1 Tax=Peribacillus sp. NPDC096379 TaxID=3364393 RepID=UPI0038056EAB